MDARRLSANRLAEKVDWEGGPLGALEFGVRAENIEDPVLRSLWRDLENGYRALTPLVTQIEQQLKQARTG
jgi:hypothetical protein